MKIAIHDGDAFASKSQVTGTRSSFHKLRGSRPNYALMKIAAYNKAHGNSVEWFIPMEQYDVVYSSKVFTFTPNDDYLPENTIRGGTGYGLYNVLPSEIDGMFPDYSIYPNCDHAVGFLTRGCIRSCPWCVVPKKEGHIRPYRDWKDVKRPDSRDIVFMDNNILALDYGISQMESMIGQDVRVDFNQGLDARLITPEVADIIKRLKWIGLIHTACDTDAELDTVLNRIDLLKQHGVKPYRLMVYVPSKDLSALNRIYALRDAGVNPYVMPYRDFEHNIQPPPDVLKMARWCNAKSIFKTCEKFEDYDTRAKGTSTKKRN